MQISNSILLVLAVYVYIVPESGRGFASAVRPSFLTAEPVVQLRSAPRHIHVWLSGNESAFPPSFFRFALLISILPQRHDNLSPYPRCAMHNQNLGFYAAGCIFHTAGAGGRVK